MRCKERLVYNKHIKLWRLFEPNFVLINNHIYIFQGQVLRNGALCCDNREASAESVQDCIKRSQQPVVKVQAVIKYGKLL